MLAYCCRPLLAEMLSRGLHHGSKMLSQSHKSSTGIATIVVVLAHAFLFPISLSSVEDTQSEVAGPGAAYCDFRALALCETSIAEIDPAEKSLGRGALRTIGLGFSWLPASAITSAQLITGTVVCAHCRTHLLLCVLRC